MSVRRCLMCGREIKNSEPNQRKYCRLCALWRAREKQKTWIKERKEKHEYEKWFYVEAERPRPELSIAQVESIARKNNMTYGVYVSRRRDNDETYT